MTTRPPRLAPTLALAVVWVMLYLLYLAWKPEPPAPPQRSPVTTTTDVAGDR